MTRTNRTHHADRRWRSRLAATAVAIAFVAAACGTDDPDGSAPPDGSGGSSTSPPATGGWVDGEPEWYGAGDGAEEEVLAAPVEESAAEMAADMVEEEAPPGDADVRIEPAPEPAPSLRAGSVDDNEDFVDFEAYLDRIASIGIETRGYDPSGRVVVTVTGADGRPVAGAEVVVSAAGAEIARVRTTADGTVRIHPALYGAGDASLDVRVGETATTVEPGGAASLSIDSPGGATAPVPLDVLFLLDATGSMGDEIDRLKQSIDSVAARVSALESQPDVRFAMTLYRDEGDAFVTSTYDFTSDVDGFRAALASVVADGGGDYPEALDEGLAEALRAPGWRDPAQTVQLVFLVADAPPQVSRQVDTPYTASIVEAIGRGIKVFPVASSESDDQAEAVFRQIAQATGARFVFLTYGAAGAATGASTDIDRTDYEELALDDLVVRLIAEELADLTGEPQPVPTTTPPSTTVPEGQ